MSTGFRTRRSAFVIFWAVSLGAGMWGLYEYQYTPSPAGLAPEQWPDETPLVRSDRSPTLLVFVHPHCPCTTATIDELERLVARLGDEIFPYAIFLHPDGTPAWWHQTRLWDRTAAIPGVRVVEDVGGTLARQFHATVSGETYLYDPAGRLLFAGGITLGRGHAGENPGSAAVVAAVTGAADPKITGRGNAPVFGCPLFEDGGASPIDRKR